MNVGNSNHIIHHVICTINIFLCSVDRASLYNFANEIQPGAQYSQYISSVLFITSTCFGPLQVHLQE